MCCLLCKGEESELNKKGKKDMATSFSRTVREEFRKYRLGPQVSRGREVFFRGPLSYSWNWKEVRIYSLK